MYSVLFFVIVGDGVEIWSRFWSSRLGKSRDLPVFFFKCSFCGATIREKTFDTSKNIFHQRGNIVKTFILRPGVCLANSSELQSQLLRPNIPTNIVCDIFLLFFVSWESWRWKREKEIFCIFCTSCIFYTFLHILHSLHILHIFAYVVCFANSSYCSYFAYSHILDILYILHFLHILHILQGHSCKIGNMRCPGTLENQNPQYDKIFKFSLLFMWSHHTQWRKNAGPPCLTHRPFLVTFFEKSDVPGQQKENYIVVVTCSNHIFVMFWLYLFN